MLRLLTRVTLPPSSHLGGKHRSQLASQLELAIFTRSDGVEVPFNDEREG